jgi:ATP-dependent Clp protease adaptor protein ClpS
VPKIKKVNEIQSLISNPPMYKVILHNDDYTPMDFVVSILVNIFHKGLNEAEELMLKVHEEGKAVCGVYVKDIAATKVTQVKEIARKNGFPLMATMELER